jgi:hypothetical protein
MQTLPVLIPMFEKIEEKLQNHEFEKAEQEVASVLNYDSGNYYAQALKRRLSRIMYVCRNPQQLLDAHNIPLEQTITALQHLCQMARKIIVQQQTGRLEQTDE